MDKLEQYRDAIEKVLLPYADTRYTYGNFQNQALFDRERDHYAIISQGWDHRGVRSHTCLIHVDIINDKVWLQYDGTDAVIADELIEAGIPQSEIVLGFHEPKIRPHTGFAVA